MLLLALTLLVGPAWPAVELLELGPLVAGPRPPEAVPVPLVPLHDDVNVHVDADHEHEHEEEGEREGDVEVVVREEPAGWAQS